MELSKQEMELFFLLLGLESKNFPRAHGDGRCYNGQVMGGEDIKAQEKGRRSEGQVTGLEVIIAQGVLSNYERGEIAKAKEVGR